MEGAGTNVLLVGNCARRSSVLGRHLLKRGCNVSLAARKKDAVELLQQRQFDVVLSGFRLPDGTAYELMEALRGTDSTMFFSFAVEDSCWWITALLQGQDRSEEAGMRPREFTKVLDAQLSRKSSRSNAQSSSAGVKADISSGSTNRQTETDARAWESKKEQCHATNPS
jgi:two-component system, OmpR family, response regulator MtrA